MDKLIKLLDCTLENVRVTKTSETAIKVQVEEGDIDNVSAVLATVADAIYDYDLGDVKIVTNTAEGTVEIEIL